MQFVSSIESFQRTGNLNITHMFVATALVVPCLMTMASSVGSEQQKGTVMGIFRSLGALARALGPIFASIAFWSLGSRVTYLTGAVALLWPVLTLKRSIV